METISNETASRAASGEQATTSSSLSYRLADVRILAQLQCPCCFVIKLGIIE